MSVFVFKQNSWLIYISSCLIINFLRDKSQFNTNDCHGTKRYSLRLFILFSNIKTIYRPWDWSAGEVLTFSINFVKVGYIFSLKYKYSCKLPALSNTVAFYLRAKASETSIRTCIQAKATQELSLKIMSYPWIQFKHIWAINVKVKFEFMDYIISVKHSAMSPASFNSHPNRNSVRVLT